MKNGKAAITTEYIGAGIGNNVQQILLDALPCIALIIKPSTCEVIAANRKSHEWGLVTGISANPVCFWKIQPDLRIGSCEQRYEFEVEGKVWDLRWIPQDEEHWLLYAVDITDRRRSERVARNRLKSLEGYRTLFTQMPEAAFIVSPDGLILDINEAASLQLGYRKPELVGQPVTKIYDTSSHGKIDTSTVLRNEEVVIKTRNSERRTVLLNTCQVCAEDGKVIHTVSLQNDITDIKRLEEESLRGQKLESLGHLAGGIAHDFNNLLGGVFGYIDLAGAKTEDERVVKYLGKALKTIERAKGLTRQLLTFAKGGAPVKRPVHLFPFIKHKALELLLGKNISFECAVQDGLWQCECDRNQIALVVENLITNAIQAMPDGGCLYIDALNIHLENKAFLNLCSGDYIKIVLRDTGSGIPSGIFPHLFDPFYSTKPKGRGLGLATSYSIIRKHGGSIDVTSTPGQGCVFTVYLPALLETERASSIHEKQFCNSGTFLIIDDEEIIRETISGMVSSAGYKGVAFEEGEEALQYIADARNRGERVAGVIVDLTIPGGLGGRETVARIRIDDQEMPVIVSSGYADDPVMADPCKYGFTASISKPFRSKELRALIGR